MIATSEPGREGEPLPKETEKTSEEIKRETPLPAGRRLLQWEENGQTRRLILGCSATEEGKRLQMYWLTGEGEDGVAAAGRAGSRGREERPDGRADGRAEGGRHGRPRLFSRCLPPGHGPADPSDL
jgi:hypothetical protein